ncbi:oxysterol-binding protein [Stylonychia lemnae]|uniref:Oxysterol-binding protein n=1 Tax=Stylonychia lemnae TaxID=5949 RepID=A0A078A8Y6_STYLE|nr:oxysterol-binding protein [Stylonychia lemnae]|eukprot:CDW78336.1 oxysterol-binding protein [Stylonychia lemnae]
MEGYLYKKDGFFSGWVQYYFILHEDTLIYLDKQGGKPQGSIHMKISKISGDQKDRLLILIFNGTNEIYLRANSIKEKVEWTNALVNCQKQCLEGRYDQFKQKKSSNKGSKQASPFKDADHDSQSESNGDNNTRASKANGFGTNWYEQLNLQFCSKMFKADGPFFMRLGQIWELEAQVEEIVSLIIPEANRTKNPLIRDYALKISQASELIKEKMTECVQEMEETRKEMFKVAKTIVKMKDEFLTGKVSLGGIHQNNQRKGSSNSNQSSPTKTYANHYNVSANSPIKLINEQLNSNSNQNQLYENYQNGRNDNHYYQGSHFQDDRNGYTTQGGGINGTMSLIQTQKVAGSLLTHENYQNNHVFGSANKAQRTSQLNQLFEEEKNQHQMIQQQNTNFAVPRNLMNSLEKGLVMGYGGIPISYTMKTRDKLPALTPENQSFSIWAILKSAIGKDLGKVTMPIWLNEPISMLQKISELMHYHEIMDKAMTFQDDCKKLGYISMFLMTQYSDVYKRTRKPFNPILGETYELIQPNYRFFCEQVSHHPPISAFYAEGKGYYTYGNTNVKNSFKATSLEFKAIGLQHMILTEGNEHIIIKRPDNSANNLVVGTLYVDVHGKLEVINITKNIKCILTIHRRGWRSTNDYKVEGFVTDQFGKNRFQVDGLWNEKYSITDLQTNQVEEVFQAEPKPPLSDRQYGFGYYTINLNNIDDHMKKTLPPTDTRRRPDQRFMEEGNYDMAAEEKHRLEEKQRVVRKRREDKQILHKPAYFKEVDDEHCGEKAYVYLGNYWEKRKKMDYVDCPDLF